MTRSETVKKLLALGDLQHSELLQCMGGDRDSVNDAVFELVDAGFVINKANGYGLPVYRLTPGAKASAFGGAHA